MIVGLVGKIFFLFSPIRVRRSSPVGRRGREREGGREGGREGRGGGEWGDGGRKRAN